MPSHAKHRPRHARKGLLTMKTLYLMRHGETMFNAQHRIQGWP